MTKTLTFRIRLSDYKGIRKTFKGIRGESAADYFHRLNVALMEIWKNE